MDLKLIDFILTKNHRNMQVNNITMYQSILKQIVDEIRFVKIKLFWESWMTSYTTTSKRIDAVSRVLFPILFVVFKMFYWYWLTNYVDTTYPPITTNECFKHEEYYTCKNNSEKAIFYIEN